MDVVDVSAHPDVLGDLLRTRRVERVVVHPLLVVPDRLGFGHVQAVRFSDIGCVPVARQGSQVVLGPLVVDQPENVVGLVDEGWLRWWWLVLIRGRRLLVGAAVARPQTRDAAFVGPRSEGRDGEHRAQQREKDGHPSPMARAPDAGGSSLPVHTLVVDALYGDLSSIRPQVAFAPRVDWRTEDAQPCRGHTGRMSIASPARRLFDDEHEQFRATVRRFVANQIVPNHEKWESAGLVDRALFARAGAIGLLGMAIPPEHGGGGVDDFRYNLVLNEEVHAAGVNGAGLGITLHNDICLPYFLAYCNDEQAERWLPGIASGELITAIGMTEPGIGSDLASMSSTAIRDGDHYIVNGAKTFITNGINADLVIAAVKTDPDERHRGISLVVIERGMAGFERGRNLDKIGLHSQDTAELFFTDVAVPVANRLGEEGEGFVYLVSNLRQERLSIAVSGVAAARYALNVTIDYCRQRRAFGQPIGSFQNSRFRLAEMATEIEIGQVFIDRCVVDLNAGTLTAETAAMAKWWCTELQKRVVDSCLQLHGGYGYMTEYPIARAYADARVTTIFGGTTEIMKEIIGRSLGV